MEVDLREKIEKSHQILSFVENGCFTNVDILQIMSMSEDERKKFILEQAERLIDEKNAYVIKKGKRYGTPNQAAWLAEQFWYYEPEEGSIKRLSNPMHDDNVLKHLGDTAKAKALFFIDLSRLCSDLYNHCLGETDALCIEGSESFLSITDDVLVEWLESTPYVHIAMHVAYTMKYQEWEWAAEVKNQVVQDYLAELRNREYHVGMDKPEVDGIPPREYIKTIIKALKAIQHKMALRRKLGLKEEEMFLHDEMHGEFVPEYTMELIPYVHELYDYLCTERTKYNFDDIKISLAPSEQSESIQQQLRAYSRGFINKVYEVRDKLGNGWMDDDSMSINYLLYHVDYKAYDCYEDW